MKRKVTYNTLAMGACGRRDPKQPFHYKRTSLLHNFPDCILGPVFKRYNNKSNDRTFRQHQPPGGRALGYGLRTKLVQVFPYNFFCADQKYLSLKGLQRKQKAKPGEKTKKPSLQQVAEHIQHISSVIPAITEILAAIEEEQKRITQVVGGAGISPTTQRNPSRLFNIQEGFCRGFAHLPPPPPRPR